MSHIATYPVRLVPAEEGGFVVLFPGLPIVTEGDTEEEALRNAEEAFLCHLEGCEKRDRDVPPSRIFMMKFEVPDTLAA